MNINLILDIQKYTLFLTLFSLFLLTINFKFKKLATVFSYFSTLVLFVHLLTHVIYKYLYVSIFDPFYIFVDVCVLCPDRNEYLINFARIAFYLVTTSTFLFLFKEKYKIIKKYFDYKDILNYISFYSFSIYACNTTLLFQTSNVLNIIFWILQITALLSFFRRIYLYFR